MVREGLTRPNPNLPGRAHAGLRRADPNPSPNPTPNPKGSAACAELDALLRAMLGSGRLGPQLLYTYIDHMSADRQRVLSHAFYFDRPES